ncbi:AMP-binding protein [Streptomyces dysideae]|uniref:AMP-dependent synthetase n=1 Tax=Streptomyces dysideae TaxID=909626 RepID=A0A101UXM8_9ACTN|nr:AMP-binding protein [Streptomyces dysideae]KUO18730.1 AMP-dependent synthetase [Streptomyces dysideae]
MPFARDLAAYGDRVAVRTADGELSYRDLAARVTATAARLGTTRRLVLLAGANRLDALVVYLAALAAGHPLLLVPGDNDTTLRSLVAAYDPDVVVRPRTETEGDATTWLLDERRPGSTHTLHPDLALLLSTSGSTGSPKLVRLSHANLQSNAESIATYLDIRDGDRAATTLPMHYCYGLSVINSHLTRGAGLILTDLSVSDTTFWDLFRTARGTALAGVPYTFDLLDRVGFDRMRLPHLRVVTQAGGRLAPERVARYAELGRRAGWDLFVMYGQTEATARMAYLSPALAAERPQAVGVPIPGGSFRLRPLEGLEGLDEPDTGELVYSGPNVMLGYAESPADLSLGRTVAELHTGDIARRAPDGLYEIVGRSSRFTKVFGLRIDPQRVEALLEERGVTAFCTGDDEALAVLALGAAEGADAARIRREVAEGCGLPPRAIRVGIAPELPRLASGKPDYEAVRRLVHESHCESSEPPSEPAAPTPRRGTTTDALIDLYARILDPTDADVTEDSSFVSLGGDSLSYVEMSLQLEQTLGELPADWHTTPIRELSAGAANQDKGKGKGKDTAHPPRRGRGLRRTLETGIALRAVGIVLIVSSHIPVVFVQGGAHVLLGVAGFNFARFHLSAHERRERLRRLWRSIARIAVPSMVWMAFVLLLTREYDLANLVLANSLFEQDNSHPEWRYWFVEALVYFLTGLALLLAVPLLDRAERRSPFGFALALVGLGLVGRYDPWGIAHIRYHLSPTVVFFLFALGWAAARARTTSQRLLLTAVLLATVPGLFPGGQPLRTSIVVGGLILLLWIPTLPSIDPLNRLAGVLAGSSLYIYLTHFHVYPYLRDDSPVLALVVSLVVGVAYGVVASRLTRRVSAAL